MSAPLPFRLAWLDLASGASGDMILAALAHVGRRSGVPVEDAVKAAVASLGLGCTVSFQRALRGGVHCLTAKVRVPTDRFDAPALRSALERSDASDAATSRAIAGLDALLRAEASVHGVELGDVHLHDLGSADTAADLLGAAVGLEALGVTALSAAPVPAPRGWVQSAAGALPLPSPAALELLRGAPMFGVDEEVELVTPTAAAVLVAHGATFGPLPPMVLDEVGVGGGSRELALPNVCRVLVGRPASSTLAGGEPAPGAEGVPDGVELHRDVLLECNIDDQPPETLGEAMTALFEAGARDAWITPIVMKKSRPAFQLSALVDPADEGRLLETIFRHTTTLGARRREVAKWVMARENLRVAVRGTNVRVKVGRIGADVVTVSPELDDCLALAKRTGASLKDVFAEAGERARRMLAEGRRD